MVKLSSIRPRLVAQPVGVMEAFLADRRIGWLDDREHLKAVSALAAAVTGRQLGRWDVAEAAYRRAESAFRRTADIDDLDRVEVERLALACSRGLYDAVKDSAPSRIEGLKVPRERIKAQLILANALMSLAQADDTRLLLQAIQQNKAVENEPALKAWLLLMLGIALSYLGKDSEAVAEFKSAGDVLQKFFHPLQLASLAGAVGEHLAKSGRPAEAIGLYEAARETFREVGVAQQVGYYSVLRAELLMLTGASEEAEAALLVALPLIEEFELQREGLAAVVLLREAMTKKRTDVKTVQALREQLRKGLHK
jgi:tetratricopeptide (TPR) repeat protein